MQKLQLFISGTRIDLFKDESVSITQTIQNIRDIKKIFTEFTKTFSIPASKVNNKIFKHYYNFDIIDGFDARNKVAASIELNNIPFKSGFVKLEGVQLKKNKPYAYKITFFGETVNLKDLVGDDELSGLSTLNSYNENYSNTTVRQKLQTLTSNTNLITPLITHGTQLFYNSASSAYVNDTGNLYYHTGTNHDHGVFWNDLKYALRLQAIIDAIESKYSITFSNDFFNDSSNTTFHNLFMWLHRKKGDVEPAEQVSINFAQLTLWSPHNTPSPRLFTANGALIVSSSLVTYPSSVDTFSLSLTPTNTSTSYDIQIFRNGSLYFSKANNTGTTLLSDSDFTMTAGNFTLKVGTADASGITFNTSNIVWEVSGTEGGESLSSSWTDIWRNGSQLSTSTTFEFVITEQIPKMKVLEFLTGLFQMFNLTAFVDTDGTIVVRTLDSFYNASTTTWDIDEFVDVQSSTVDLALPYREVELGYKGLNTFLAKQYEQLENKGWGTLNFTLDNAKYDAPEESYAIELPFEHLQYQRLVNASGGANTTIQWGWFVNDNQEPTYSKPLLFYAILQSSSTTNISFRNSSNTHQSISSYIIPSNSLAISSSTSTTNINFSLEQNEYTLDTSFTGTLFENFYKNYLTDIYNNKRRLTKVKAYIPLKMIYNLKLNDKISLNNNNYRINSITTNLTTGESSLELLNIV
tara:strand:- start:397 stop:2472 length:2076 start_codon:yes stop_codon:yes gene_type:complete